MHKQVIDITKNIYVGYSKRSATIWTKQNLRVHSILKWGFQNEKWKKGSIKSNFWKIFSLLFIKYSGFHLYGLIHIPNPFYHLSSFFPLHLSFILFPPEVPLQNGTAVIFSYAVAVFVQGAGKSRKTCANTVGHLIDSVSSLQSPKKWPLGQQFDVQGRTRICGHPSKYSDPTSSYLTWVIVRHRTLNTNRTLSVPFSFNITTYFEINDVWPFLTKILIP